MSDTRYQYERVNAVKIILENPNGKILLIQEPETNEWMPGHWGLPGGKPLEKESLYQTFKRKIKGDLGLEVEPEGIFRIEELLIDGRTVFMFHLVARLTGDHAIEGEIKSYKWAGKEEVEEMGTEEFTEYFNKKLLLAYLKGSKALAPISLIESQKYYDLVQDPDYKKWFESGKKK